MKEKVDINGKLVGIIDTDEGIYTTYRFPFHYMIKFGGFGISIHVLQVLQAKGVRKIRIIYKGRDKTDMEYLFDLSEYLDSEDEYNHEGDVQKFVKVPRIINNNVKGGQKNG